MQSLQSTIQSVHTHSRVSVLTDNSNRVWVMGSNFNYDLGVSALTAENPVITDIILNEGEIIESIYYNIRLFFIHTNQGRLFLSKFVKPTILIQSNNSYSFGDDTEYKDSDCDWITDSNVSGSNKSQGPRICVRYSEDPGFFPPITGVTRVLGLGDSVLFEKDSTVHIFRWNFDIESRRRTEYYSLVPVLHERELVYWILDFSFKIDSIVWGSGVIRIRSESHTLISRLTKKEQPVVEWVKIEGDATVFDKIHRSGSSFYGEKDGDFYRLGEKKTKKLGRPGRRPFVFKEGLGSQSFAFSMGPDNIAARFFIEADDVTVFESSLPNEEYRISQNVLYVNTRNVDQFWAMEQSVLVLKDNRLKVYCIHEYCDMTSNNLFQVSSREISDSLFVIYESDVFSNKVRLVGTDRESIVLQIGSKYYIGHPGRSVRFKEIVLS